MTLRLDARLAHEDAARLVHEAMECINVNETSSQSLDLQFVTLPHVTAQLLVNFLQRLPARLVHEAMECINVNETSQSLDLQFVTLPNVTAQLLVNFLQRLPPGAVNRLWLCCHMTPRAMEILRAYFGTTTSPTLILIPDLDPP
jgi:hypothetical protein